MGRNAWVPCLILVPPYQPPRMLVLGLYLHLWALLSVFCNVFLVSQVTDSDTRGLYGISCWQRPEIKSMGWRFKQAWVQTLSLHCDLK